MHVHVSHPDGEAKFWMSPELALATSTGLSSKQIKEAQNMASGYCLATKNYFCHSQISPGFGAQQSSNYARLSCP